VAQGQKRNKLVIPEAAAAMEQFKWETAKEVGINLPPGSYMGDVPSRMNGAIGGHMVRKMIQAYEESLAAGKVPQTGPPQGSI